MKLNGIDIPDISVRYVSQFLSFCPKMSDKEPEEETNDLVAHKNGVNAAGETKQSNQPPALANKSQESKPAKVESVIRVSNRYYLKKNLDAESKLELLILSFQPRQLREYLPAERKTGGRRGQAQVTAQEAATGRKRPH